ncbi:zinc finger, C3HC4 type (RING finger) domain protein [Toxoplasma gondii MAS]|uniref:Zinc finger, C3HC4 type (RING finger) domain protein n=1 Tax=Toxoplasma gondii MAS TaxID=943118 RepID=A0A086QYD7_TOXGO|nr:zinc finger, C3HC4 type (RING finger) domain protein [Toxoplasma gondii MAS]
MRLSVFLCLSRLFARYLCLRLTLGLACATAGWPAELRHEAPLRSTVQSAFRLFSVHAEPYTPLVVILALPSTDPQTVSAAADLFNSFSPLPASVIQSAMAPYLRQAAARAGSPGAGDAGSFVISAAREESETGIASAREGLPAQAPPDAPAPSAGGACRDSSATSLTEGDRRGDREATEERREAPVSPPASAPPRTDEEIAAAVAVEMLAEESVALASEPSIAAATLWGMTQAAALNLSPIAAFHLEIPDFLLTVGGYQVPGFIGRLIERGLRCVIDMMGIRAIPLPPIPRIAAVPILATDAPHDASAVPPPSSDQASVSSSSSPSASSFLSALSSPSASLTSSSSSSALSSSSYSSSSLASAPLSDLICSSVPCASSTSCRDQCRELQAAERLLLSPGEREESVERAGEVDGAAEKHAVSECASSEGDATAKKSEGGRGEKDRDCDISSTPQTRLHDEKVKSNSREELEGYQKTKADPGVSPEKPEETRFPEETKSNFSLQFSVSAPAEEEEGRQRQEKKGVVSLSS